METTFDRAYRLLTLIDRRVFKLEQRLYDIEYLRRLKKR